MLVIAAVGDAGGSPDDTGADRCYLVLSLYGVCWPVR